MPRELSWHIMQSKWLCKVMTCIVAYWLINRTLLVHHFT
jgi:hypothetical protein